MATLRLCSILDCGKPSRQRGWCYAHYMRWRRHGDVHATAKTPNGERRDWIDSHSAHVGDECLTFPYSLGPKGNASIMIDGKHTNVYRYMCELAHGEPPTGDYDAAHTCGNRHLGCIHPDHLRWATPLENMQDQWSHGTRMKGQAVPQSKLAPDDVREIRALQGAMLQKDIAAKFGVSRSLIGHIHSRKAWAWM